MIPIKKWLLLAISLVFVAPLFSQSISANINFPVGEFSKTHFVGLGLEYAPSAHAFRLHSRDSSTFRKSRIAFTYNAGASYYLGKKETVSGHVYKYPGYLFIHAFGGLLYVPARKTEIKLTAGPAFGIYDGTTRFNIGGKLQANYFINSIISIGPGILLMKEFGADPLWTAFFKVGMDF